ncbi:S49 family peptidase [Extensimonas vulgaris]|uniref:Protein C n=1 Tax=Extensimonas vulgaris TaxID=1031594 RepID=A0A369AK04_9BURK|nr:S49 family peptidase [Extensimonas vulgaris]RCX08616.1 protein C [Extensimonas vulgaris]TWI36231.1 signal peptide peptidase SppA [Extensimonas vulgaris]TXD13987.1 S49 family peptidase [Extensimonas vulgaris]
MHLIHLASRILGTPLLIARPKLDVILSVLGSRIGLPDRDMAFPIPEPKQARAFAQSGIAVIPVFGTLVKRSLGLDAASGLMAYGELESRLETALADPQVAGILLDLDSPGGEAGGVFELAERIRAASTIKPIWAHANDAAYSAAFAIGAACQRLTLSQTAGVGSIGVIALHVDQSVKDAKDGLNYTSIFAGSHKNDFSPHEPLSPQATTALQAEVDRLYDIFVNQVGQMRGLDPDAVRATEAGLFYGEQAVAAGLADAVMPLEQVMTEFTDALAAKQRLTQPGVARASPRNLSTQPISSPPRSKPFTLENTMTDPKNDHDNPNDPTDTDPQGDQPQTDSDPQPTPAAQAALALSFASGRGQAQAIAEMCLIAGQSQRTAEFLAAGFSEAQVRRALLDARADQPEIASRITADAGTSQRPENSPVVAAVKKLTAKE